MDEETSTSHLVFLKSIRDGNLVLGDEPYITIDATMIGKVKGHLFLARRVGFVVAIVCADGNDDIIAYGTTRKRNRDGQITTLVLLHFFAIDVDGLFAHDGFEVQGNITTSTLLGQHKMLAIPRYALIVATTTSLCRHQLDRMGR